MKLVFILLIPIISLFAAVLSPRMSIEAGGNVQSMIIDNNTIFVGTSVGTLEGYTLKDGSATFKFSFDAIKDFMGDTIAPKVFSIDKVDGAEIYLAVLQASSGARSLVLIEGNHKTELINASANMFITKAKFLDANTILIALMSNELIRFDRKTKKFLYQKQVNSSHFSDFALNETKTQVASSCESGEITITDTLSGKTLKVLSGGNVDNVYKVDFKKELVLGAGQDRRGIIYHIQTGAYQRYDASFLIYAGALSPTAHNAAFAINEENDIALFDTTTQTQMHTLRGQKSTLNTIVFATEKDIVSGSDDKFIMIWRLP
jgi:WD40 repeat protein